MNSVENTRRQKFLARASLAEQRAQGSAERVEKTMWEEIAQCWRELARQAVPHPGA